MIQEYSGIEYHGRGRLYTRVSSLTASAPLSPHLQVQLYLAKQIPRPSPARIPSPHLRFDPLVYAPGDDVNLFLKPNIKCLHFRHRFSVLRELPLITMAAPTTSGLLASNDPTKPRSDAAVPFRDIIPSPDHPRIAGIANHNAHTWCDSRRQIEAPAWLINRLDAVNIEKPLKGFTTDGKVKEGVWEFAEDEGAPTEKAIGKTEELLAILSDEEKKAVQCGEVTDDSFRLWSNPELYMNPGLFVLFDRELR